MIESAARANDLPLEFFARVIWQESRFQSDAVGPVDAQRPARARHRAIHAGNRERAPAARSLRSRAGAAEIGGIPERAAQPVRQSRACRCRLQCRDRAGCRNGSRAPASMPQETRNYVSAITGSTVDDWAAAGKGGKMRRPSAPHDHLPRLDGAAASARPTPSSPSSKQHVQLAAAKLWGVQLAAGFDRNKALAMYARAMTRLSAVIGDQDPSLLSSRDAHPRHAHLLSGADRRRHAACGRRSLQPHPPRRRGLFRAAEHGGA